MFKFQALFCIILVLFFLSSVQAVEEKSKVNEVDEKDVVILTDKTFEETIKKSKNALVEFYAPWCGHCKALTPKYAKAATVLKEAGDDVILAKVDATVEKKSAELFQVKGYPTLMWISDGQINSSKKYQGGRETDDIVTWVRQKSGPAIKAVDSEQEIADQEKVKDVVGVAYIQDFKSADYELLESIAKTEDDVKIFATNDSAVAKKLGFSSAPQFALITNHKDESRKFEIYSQKTFERKPIEDFIKSNKLPLVTEFSFKTQVKIFSSDIKKQVIVLGSGHLLKENLETLQKAAKNYKGKLLFITVNTTDTANKKVEGYFGGKDTDKKIFLIGYSVITQKKYWPEADFSEQVLDSFANDFVKDKAKVHYKSDPIPTTEHDTDGLRIVVGDNFDQVVKDKEKDVFLELYAPWCGHCQKLKPVLEELAKNFSSTESVVIAKMDGAANEVPDLEVHGFPTIYMYPATDKAKPIKFSGDRQLPNLVQFVKDNAKKPIEKKEKQAKK